MKEWRSYLINKNLALYYKLRRLIGKKKACKICSWLEKIIGRDICNH